MAGFASKRRRRPRLLDLAAAGLALALSMGAASAQVGSDRYASITIDAGTGEVLSAVNADEYRFPASLTKLMTVYMLFEALRDRRLALSQPVPVSSWAASMMPSKLGLLPGTYITVEQALLGLVTKSANDAAAALGELMGGDEERFAQMMTLRARALGMTRTTFRNASGLPDEGQVTTARDLAVLARHLVQDFPLYYWYFSVPSFSFQGRTVLNHQRMLQTYPGADGLKTGYIGASGFNVVTSALRSDTRLIGVVLGAGSGWERDQHMASLLDQGFEREGVPVMAQRDTSAPYRINQFISLAQAAPFAATPQPRDYLIARGGHRRVRLAQAASPQAVAPQAAASHAAVSPNLRAASSRRGQESRGERLHPRPIMALLPHSVRPAPFPASAPSHAAPARAGASSGRAAATRTAVQWTGRSPG